VDRATFAPSQARRKAISAVRAEAWRVMTDGAGGIGAGAILDARIDSFRHFADDGDVDLAVARVEPCPGAGRADAGVNIELVAERVQRLDRVLGEARDVESTDENRIGGLGRLERGGGKRLAAPLELVASGGMLLEDEGWPALFGKSIQDFSGRVRHLGADAVAGQYADRVGFRHQSSPETL
jgi:uncharacterized protein YbjQ (UPF0145 family)